MVVCQAAERVSKNLLLPDTWKILSNCYEKPFPVLFKVFYLQLELPSDQETKSGFAAEPGCCFLALQVTWVGSAPKSKPLPFYIPFLTENVPPGTPDILASHTGVPPLPTKRGENHLLGRLLLLSYTEDLKLLKLFLYMVSECSTLSPGSFRFLVCLLPIGPRERGLGILCNHSYSAINFLPEGLPGLQAT